jgi:hypothetical protein
VFEKGVGCGQQSGSHDGEGETNATNGGQPEFCARREREKGERREKTNLRRKTE